MARFLTTHGVAAQIEEVITQARERLVLVSPYLRLSAIFFERLQDAVRRGVTTTIVYGKSELADDQTELLDQLRKLQLLFLPQLHAKCYFNELRMVITSMNMYDFSEKTNREMGILLEAGGEAYEQAVAEVDSIIRAAHPVPSPTRAYSGSPGLRTAPQSQTSGSEVHRRRSRRSGGQCIRCRRSISLNPDRPLCNDCFSVWAQFGDPDYIEAYCHACGRRNDTTMRRPLCRSCFRDLIAY